MRQAILVVVLVAASFLGGAFVNGPGLRWAQTRVLRSLGLSDGGEIASVDLEGNGKPRRRFGRIGSDQVGRRDGCTGRWPRCLAYRGR